MARELGLRLTKFLRATRRAARAQKDLFKTTKAVKAEQSKLESGDTTAKARLRLLKREERRALGEARQARRAAFREQNAIYKDSRVNLQGIYATIGNHREKLPTLFRSLSNPAGGGIATLVSVFGEGVAGVTKAAPFMAAAGGFLALLYPILEERDKQQRERILSEVKGLIEEAGESFFQRFQESAQFAGRATNEAIDAFVARREDLAKAGWVNSDDVEFEGF